MKVDLVFTQSLFAAVLLTTSIASPQGKRLTNQVFNNSASAAGCGTGAGTGNDTYILHLGDGSQQAGWPMMNQWISFNTMWQHNLGLIENSCGQFNVTSNSGIETLGLKAGIEFVANQTRVDNRFILAITMQESKGCVRVPKTVSPDHTVVNPGLLQDHNGTYSCNTIQGTCPLSAIYGMILEGVGGTTSGPGLAELLDSVGSFSSPAQQYYKAARMYNSGSIAPSGDLEAGGATHCYVSDVANRLTGWVYAASTCTLDTA